jgi:hypothetical protein
MAAEDPVAFTGANTTRYIQGNHLVTSAWRVRDYYHGLPGIQPILEFATDRCKNALRQSPINAPSVA